jgi:hypothetical protein
VGEAEAEHKPKSNVNEPNYLSPIGTASCAVALEDYLFMEKHKLSIWTSI